MEGKRNKGPKYGKPNSESGISDITVFGQRSSHKMIERFELKEIIKH
jgi:hypothetical protein